MVDAFQQKDRESQAINHAASLFLEGRYLEAAYYYGVAANINENYTNISNQAMAFFKARNFAEAMDCFLRAGEISSSSGNYFNTGACAEQIGLYENAQDLFLKALSIDESNYPAALGLCRMYRRSRMDIEELRLLLKIRAKKPGTNVDIDIFNCLHRLGRPRESMTVYNIVHNILDPISTIEVDDALLQFHQDLWGIMKNYDNSFGSGGFYQSWDDLLIPGMRPTSKRYDAYKLESFLTKDMSVLDIGCNHGFLSLKIAQNVKNVVGVDSDQYLIETAKLAEKYLNARNVEFLVQDARLIQGSYNLILSCAVHQWIGLSILEYADWISSLLEVDGLVIFESNDLQTFDMDFDKKIEAFCSRGYLKIAENTGYDDNVIPRKVAILRATR